MEGYDINKIELKSDKDPSTEELLTGKYITGLDTTAEMPPNAELEGGEYIQFPDGTTQLVAGEDHEKGGVKMFIPDGSRMVSKSLFLNKRQAKQIKEDYGFNVSTKDSYAKAIDKFANHIGLEKNYKEQEELYKIIKKEQDKEMPDATRNVNTEYLSGKVNSLDKDAQKLEIKKAEFFNTIFDMQEQSKSLAKRRKAAEGNMEYGGVSEQQFRDLCKQQGISYEQGLTLIGKKPATFEEGGKFDELKEKFNTVEKIDRGLEDGLLTNSQYQKLMLWAKGDGTQFTTKSGAHDYTGGAEILQHISDGAFGDIDEKDVPKVLKFLYMNFPDIVSRKDIFDVKFNDQGEILWNKKIDFTKESEFVRKFQKLANERMKASDNSILSQDAGKYFSGEFQDIARDHLENQTFGEGTARGEDGKLGNFTSGRYINSVNVLTPEELKKVQDMNLYTLSQVEKELKNNPELLSPETQERIKKLRDVSLDNSDYRLDQFEGAPAVEKGPPADPPGPGTSVQEMDIQPPRPYYPRLFERPNQYPLPPSGMESHLMGETRFQRMDPIRVGIEPQIQEAGEQRQFMAEQMFGNLAPNVAASVMANEAARQTKAINQEARAANMVNANNLASTELFNIGQAGKESEARLRNLLSFEQRQLTAKAKTEEEVRNFYDQIRRIHINDFKTHQNLNMLNQMFPDFNLSSTGMTVDFEPTYDWAVKNNPFVGLFGEDPYV